MASRRQLLDDAVNQLQRYVPSAKTEDYIKAILNGGVDKIANVGTATDAAQSTVAGLRETAITPLIDLVNGGRLLKDIVGPLAESIDTANPESTRSTVSRFVRFTLTTKGSESVSAAPRSFIVSNKKLKTKNPTQATAPDYYPLEKALKTDYSQFDNFSKPTKSTPNIAVIELLNSRIGTAVRDTAALSVFCSLIPAHIMSRAVPYVNVRVIDPGIVDVVDGKAYASTLNLIRYLKGRQEFSPTSLGPTSGMILSLNKSNAQAPTPGGMEMFTSPQTMVTNLDDITTANFGNSLPIDRFRPFMTLKSLGLDVVPAGAGMLNYKKASMEITLHDRGRLAEISQLVKPGGYSNLEIEIEYGWSIDPRSQNATVDAKTGAVSGFALQDNKMAQFIDALRVKEKFQIITSNFRFEDSGEVTISLSLMMKGSFDMRNFDISGDENKAFALTMKQSLAEINRKIQGTNGRAENIFGETLISSVSSPEAVLELDKEEIKKLQDLASKLTARNSTASDDIKAIATSLSSILKGGPPPAANSIGKRIEELTGATEVFSACPDGKSLKQVYKSLTSAAYYDKQYKTPVSLGRIILAFIAIPLAKTKKYDEIQLIFGKLNDRAGMVRSLSLAAFPIDASRLKDQLTELYQKNITVTAAQLMGVLGEKFVNYQADPAYGFGGAYNDKGELNADIKLGQSVVDKALGSAGIRDLNFQQPELSFSAECVPSESDPNVSILRILVFDKACNPYQTYSEALGAARNDTTAFVDATGLEAAQPLSKGSEVFPDIDPALITKDRTDLISSMVSKNILQAAKSVDAAAAMQNTDTTAYNIDLSSLYISKDWKAAKKFFMESIPTIRYGVSAGMITSLGLSSISSGPLANINIMKSNESGDETEGSSREKGIPLTIAPTQVEVQMLGCPIISYGQTVYVDFGTNTSADNVYACTGISHKLDPGSYTTTMKLTGIGTYGAYTSTVRSVDLTTQYLMQYVTGEAAAQQAQSAATTTTPAQKLPEVKWRDVALSLTIQNIQTTVKSESDKGNNPLGIRQWIKGRRTASSGVAISGSSQIEIYFSEPANQALADSEFKAREAILGEDSTAECYEIEFLAGYRLIDGLKLTAKKYGPGGPGIVTDVIVDMTSYNTEWDILYPPA
jgi:hypothetical protein